MRPAEIAAHRLEQQWIARPWTATPAEVVRHLVALQAQDFLGAMWSIGLRLVDTTERQIDSAIARREIVRGWPLRGTLHFVAAGDLGWLLTLGAAQTIARFARRYDELELVASEFTRSQQAWRSLLAGGGAMTREEASAELVRAGISPDGQRAIHLLQRAALDGLLCFGPRRGKQQTFVLLDEWLPGEREAARRWTRREALAELARRYFASRGPASRQDFQWWSGLTAADASAALESARGALRELPPMAGGAGRPLWMTVDAPPVKLPEPEALLLPGFDEYLLSYQDRSAVLDPADAGKLHGGGGVLSPTLVLRGHVAGTWRRTLKPRAVELELMPFTQLAAGARRAAARAGSRFSDYLELDLRMDGAPERGAKKPGRPRA